MSTMDQYVDQKLLEPPAKGGNIPAFLTKLWKIVEDEQYDDLISWNENGTTIKIHDQVSFSQEILPKFYKHNNFSSFIRQVNMYGFRKIIDVTGAKNGDGDWEFYHTYFQRDHPENIIMIKRKGQIKEEAKVNTNQLANLLQDVEKLKNHHSIVDEKLNLVKVENERLWREVFDLRERHQSQQTMIVKLIQFFLQLVMNKDGSRKRRYPVEEEIPEKVFFQKRALHCPTSKSKMAIQCYDGASASLTEILGSNSSAEQSPVAVDVNPDHFTDAMPLNNTTLEVVDEKKRSGDDISQSTTNPAVVHLDGSSTINNPDIIKTQPIVTSPTSPFIFPEVYKPDQESIIDLSACISTDDSTPSSLLYAVKTGTPSSVVKKLPTLSTPIPTPLSTSLSTPVVTIPTTLMRQTSFKDREEVSTNVEKISQSIEALQDMLNKQEINFDMKNVNLNSLYGEIANNTSIQELLKMVSQQGSEENSIPPIPTTYPSDNNETFQPAEESFERKVIPYSEFSPSHYIDPEYGHVDVENDDEPSFFDNVLGEVEEEEDENIIP